MSVGAIASVSPIARLGALAARSESAGARPLMFTIGDGAAMTNVTVTIRNGTGQTVHTGFLERLSGTTSYAWTAPAGSSGTGYYISWDGQRVADNRPGMLI